MGRSCDCPGRFGRHAAPFPCGDYNSRLSRATPSSAVPSSQTDSAAPDASFNASLAISLPTFKAGERAQLPPFSGSSDALTVAQLAIGRKSLLAVLTASASDAQRLLDEIPWFAPELRVRLLPDWETLPYDSFSPHHDLISERLATLYAITRGECDVLLVPASTAAYRFTPPAYLAAYTFFFKKGETLDAEQFRAQLTLAGYTNVTNVVSPGEYSIRGGLVDLFPMGSQLPYRIDLFGDEIESIKTFDVDTQRTLYPVPEVRLLPAREFPLDDKGRTRFRQRFREVFEGDPAKSGIYKDISAGIASAGIEYWLPLFFEETATLFDYLPGDTALCLHNNVPEAIRDFWRDAQARYDMLSGEKTRPLLPPDELFLAEEPFFTAAKPYTRIVLAKGSDGPTAPVPPVAVDRRADDPLAKLKAFVDNFPGRVLLLAETAGRRETLSGLFAEYGLKPDASADLSGFLAANSKLSLGVAPLHEGFVLDQFAFITEAELYAGSPSRRSRHAAQRKASLDNWLRDLTELKVGDPVVHEQHGIARYQGLIHMDLGEGDMEFLELHYANESKLYVPVSQLHVISRYSGSDPDAAPLHTLGTQQWEKAKRRAAMQARDTAAELLALYAQRAARKGHAFEFTAHDYDAFADGFGFEETPDQAAAINAVIDDMKSGKPMDRLVCGDVGFGKTEVALRAAFCAVAGGKQVAVLCPTTLLCEQHFQTFSDRFADWPVKIVELSRFKTAKETTQALKELAEGKVDIVIGTHKLLQKDVKFTRLGLVVIDEEHRFGVRQKEALKALRAEVDVLTLTATPIPRTLGMSLEGLRDFTQQRSNLLLCTTIIETGIDNPHANTIVINRADKFGLAQLHQLRGRVGRSHHQAYAYLLVPDVQGLTKQAAMRLDAIQSMEELGSGFYLAMHDLEIRGAGEVLGENQSGNMMEVGFQLYNDMLSEAVSALKAGREPDLMSPFGATTEINLHAPALLPDAYCGDVHTRLNLYKRLATAEKSEHIDALLEEITDRFGKLPAQGQTLFDTHRLRVLAKPYGVAKIDAGPKLMNVSFRPKAPVDPMAIIALVQKNRHIRLAGNDKLRIERPLPDPASRAQMVRDVLRSLGQPVRTAEPSPA